MTRANFIPRHERPMVWARRAADEARARGESALQAGLAMIGGGFCPARYWVNEKKLRVELAIRRGEWHPANRAEYSLIAMEAWPGNFDATLRRIEGLYWRELQHRDRLNRHGLPAGRTRMNIRRLAEARLFLRWFRRFGNRRRFPDIVEGLCASPHIAAPVRVLEFE